jgi:signal transduction histidine kinase/putative methionine-R-sulfoxide reductase with GAF domain
MLAYNLNMLLRRAFLYAFLTVLTASAYALLVAGSSLILIDGFNLENPLANGALIFLLALTINPLRVWIQARVENSFSKDPPENQPNIEEFSNQISNCAQVTEIVDLFRKYLDDWLSPTSLLVFLHDPLSDHYTTPLYDNWESPSDLHFNANSPLPVVLAKQSAPLIIDNGNLFPEALLEEKARLALLRSNVLLPLHGSTSLLGWASLGPTRSGWGYTDRDFQIMQGLAGQAALVIERCLATISLERREHEMNVLRRVSQGINITLAFDDLLELIYAQSIQVAPATDFRITYQDPYRGYLCHSFYLENDDRLNEKEGIPLPEGVGLEQLIVETKRPMLSDDYERECSRNAVHPEMKGVFAWMGVPLIAGSETIGLLSLGSRDESVIYTNEQTEILQAIADQAAGAIVKSHLLEESDRRTRQLNKLNEGTRYLTSTLELKSLFKQILSSAVEIMNCEGGRLLMLDQAENELVYEAALGPVADELVGERLPAGTGLVGKAVQSRQTVTANRARQIPASKDKLSKLQDTMAVPMLVKGQVIGAIEVVNKKDNLPFNPDDQELLTAFASQAATAVENARLYTLTDQALAARVEELSVMQRIDRELNASLDVRKAMGITLKWAMMQSESQTGLIGWVDPKGIQVVASAGNSPGAVPIDDTLLSYEGAILDSALQAGLPRAGRVRNSAGGSGLLADVQTLIVVPIQRETGPMAALFLESSRDRLPSDETLSFLSRLSDHAAIAIANAQLYGEVQAANLAKSEFVSFVSHELKTPMTSIKGFTDLLAAQVVGPVNEAQSNFLSTIRSNVDRMATLVSDLADVSRIEAGRLQLDFNAVSLQEVVGEVVRSFRSQVESKEQNLILELPEDLPNAWGDRNRLIQILTNFFSNAHKYSPAGGKIHLTVSAVKNQWDPGGALQVLHISVQDAGFGISEEDCEKIFQKFFRSEDQKIRDSAGTGLGLSITKTLVEMQGGKIWFDSQYRKGTTFHFTVPIVESTTLEA